MHEICNIHVYLQNGIDLNTGVTYPVGSSGPQGI